MAGFDNDTVYGTNVDFSGQTVPAPTITNNAQMLIGSTALNAGGTHINVGTITSPNNSITFGYSSPNITATVNTNVVPDLHVAKWIVNPIPNSGGNQTTIQGAINAASSGDTIFVMPGTYTENLTLKAGVNIVSFISEAPVGQIMVVGKMTANNFGSGSCVISGIDFHTNGDFLLVNSGTTATNVNLIWCTIVAVANTAISFTNSNANSQITLQYCTGDIATTGIAYYASSSAGTITITGCNWTNSGNSTTANSNSSGIVNVYSSIIKSPFSTSSTGVINQYYTLLDTSAINTACVTTAGSGTNILENCDYRSGSASAISIGSGTTANIYNNIVNSSNTNAITGAGTINYGIVTFTGSSSTINTTTKVPTALPVLQGGTGLTSTTINQLLYSSAANTIAGLATANSGVLTTSSSGVPSIDTTNFSVLSTGMQMKGNNTNTAPPAGFIGEQIRSAIASGSAVALSNGVIANITSISLTAGIWDATGIVSFNGTPTTNVGFAGSIVTTSATTGTGGDNATTSSVAPTASSTNSLTIPSYRLTLNATTTVYLTCFAGFGGGSCNGFGRISATRVG